MADYNRNNGNQGEIEFRIIEKLGVIDAKPTGWNRELNVVAWNGGPPKFDIREWSPDHEKMSKGITLHEREAVKLVKFLARRLDIDEPINPQAEQTQASEGSSLY
jgi:hypothetical protein